MNYSSVVITLSAASAADTLEKLSRMEGLEMHHVDASNHRAVGVIEAENTGLEVDLFERLRRTPGVVDVSLVSHLFEEEAQ